MRGRFLALILVLTAVLAVAYCGSREGDAPLEWAAASVPNASEVQAPLVVMSVRLSGHDDYLLDVHAAIPYCQNFDRIVARRSGSEIEVAVINRVVGHGVVSLCAEGYRSVEHLTVNLGRDFEPGAVYTVLVNDQTLAFTAGSDAFSQRGSVGKVPQPIPELFPPLKTREGEARLLPVAARATGSDPASYVLDVPLGFGACIAFRRVDVRQSGQTIHIRKVYYWYRIPEGPLDCDTEDPGDPESPGRISIDLGTDFEPGVTYTVYSEGQVLTEFTAQ